MSDTSDIYQKLDILSDDAIDTTEKLKNIEKISKELIITVQQLVSDNQKQKNTIDTLVKTIETQNYMIDKNTRMAESHNMLLESHSMSLEILKASIRLNMISLEEKKNKRFWF